MRIKSLTIQNTFLFGNNKQTINFENLSESDEATLNILIGKNGHGKSSIINCLKIGMYFDKVPIGVSEISNDINGNGYIKVELESFNSIWSIESNYTRTSIKSIIIHKDGELIDTGKIPETKKYVYERILDVEYHIFSNIVSLSMVDFKSFISMTPKDTRAIRDRIFGFYILNEMNEQNKIGMKTYLDKLVSNNVKKEFIEGEIEKLKANMQSDDKISELEKEIELLKGINTEKTTLSGEKVDEMELWQKKCDNISKYLEYLELEAVKTNISEQKQSIIDLEKNLEILKKTETKTTDEIQTILTDIQVYYKKTSLKQYNNYSEQIGNLKKKIDKQLEIIDSAKTEYNELLKSRAYVDFNNAIDFILEDQLDLHTVRNQYISENKLIESFTTQITELKELKEQENAGYVIKEQKLEKNNYFLGLYKEGKCPTCETLFSDAEYSSKMSELEDDNRKLEIELPIIKESVDGKDLLIKEVEGKLEASKRKSIELKISLKVKTNITNEKYTNEKYNFIDDSKKSELIEASYVLLNYTDISTEVDFESDKKKFEAIKFNIQFVDLKEDALKNKEEEIKNLSKEHDELDSTKKVYQDEIDKFDKSKIEEIDKLKFQLEEVNDENVANKESKIEELKKKSVGQLITDEFTRKQNIELEISKLELKLVEDETQFEEVKTLFEGVELEELNSQFEEATKSVTEISEENLTLTEEIDKNTQTINNNNLIITNNKNLMVEKMAEYTKQIDEVINEYAIINKSLIFLKIVEYSLSDKGIKSFIIAKIIPYINHSVNSILSNFDLPLTIKFDDEFKPSIYRFGNEASFRTISLGQSKMIDFSIICTIVKFIKNKCTDLNVVFLDEIFSSLHVSMLPIVLEITKREIVDGLNMNVFLVNHSVISPTFFDNKIEVNVENNFAQIKLSKMKNAES